MSLILGLSTTLNVSASRLDRKNVSKGTEVQVLTRERGCQVPPLCPLCSTDK